MKKHCKGSYAIEQKYCCKTPAGKTPHTQYVCIYADGRIGYIAASPFELETEMKKFYDDIAILIKEKMSIEEIFFYASLIHLVFVKIHPWNDGNGRSARRLEKWFLAQKLSEKPGLFKVKKTIINSIKRITKTFGYLAWNMLNWITNERYHFC